MVPDWSCNGFSGYWRCGPLRFPLRTLAFKGLQVAAIQYACPGLRCLGQGGGGGELSLFLLRLSLFKMNYHRTFFSMFLVLDALFVIIEPRYSWFSFTSISTSPFKPTLLKGEVRDDNCLTKIFLYFIMN